MQEAYSPTRVTNTTTVDMTGDCLWLNADKIKPHSIPWINRPTIPAESTKPTLCAGSDDGDGDGSCVGETVADIRYREVNAGVKLPAQAFMTAETRWFAFGNETKNCVLSRSVFGKARKSWNLGLKRA